MTSILYIHAANIHQGGGAQLLKILLAAVDPDVQVVLNVDWRMPLPENLQSSIIVRKVNRSVFARLSVEWWLYRNAKNKDTVLCFGNLPPLFPVSGFVSVFVQNRYLIDRPGLQTGKIWPRLRTLIERAWLRLCSSHADQFLVQTPSMQQLVYSVIKEGTPVRLAPLAESFLVADGEGPSAALEQLPRFVYVASGEEHKNHRKLLRAWCLLASEEIRPTLILTVDERQYTKLCDCMKKEIQGGRLKVTNVGVVDKEKITELYRKSDVLIYPSLIESFGLPLIEARSEGLDVIAGELDFVRDVSRPVQTFDPTSVVSIARAVKRYCGYYDPLLKPMKPEQFFRIMQGGVD